MTLERSCLAWASVVLGALHGCPLPPNVVGVQTGRASSESSESGEATEDNSAEEGAVLDVELGDCDPPPVVSCDAASDDPLHVVGLDCIGGTPATGGVTAPAGAVAPHLGTIGPYEVREGDKFLIMSTGLAAHVPLSPKDLSLVCDEPNPEDCLDTNHGEGPTSLPAPIDVNPVDPDHTCVNNPELIGTGDCSNSLFEQWSACGGGCEVWDYAELRVGLTTPEHSYGLAFDFAFMSTEWPLFVGAGFNDMFVAWLESESWTGNVSFDDDGDPITVNAGFTDYTTSELDSFAMRGHAGTRWLTTAFGVEPGEQVQLVLAVFDLSDGDHDSVVFLDSFRWTCTGTPPTTSPEP